MNINFHPNSREWLMQQNGKDAPSAAARVAKMVEAIALFRIGAIPEAEFLQTIRQL